MTRKSCNTARVNAKRTKLLQNIGKGMNVSEAGRASGYGTAQSAHRALNRMGFYLPEILQRMNIPAEKVLKKLDDQLEAKETKFLLGKNGKLIETPARGCHEVQHRAAVELAKIHRLYPRNGHDNGASDAAEFTAPTVNLVFTDPARAASFADSLSRLGRYSRPTVLDAGVDSDEGRAGPVRALEAGPVAPTNENSGRPVQPGDGTFDREKQEHDDLMGDYPPGTAPDYDPTAI